VRLTATPRVRHVLVGGLRRRGPAGDERWWEI
jgi:hypothetical protein